MAPQIQLVTCIALIDPAPTFLNNYRAAFAPPSPLSHLRKLLLYYIS